MDSDRRDRVETKGKDNLNAGIGSDLYGSVGEGIMSQGSLSGAPGQRDAGTRTHQVDKVTGNHFQTASGTFVVETGLSGTLATVPTSPTTSRTHALHSNYNPDEDDFGVPGNRRFIGGGDNSFPDADM